MVKQTPNILRTTLWVGGCHIRVQEGMSLRR